MHLWNDSVPFSKGTDVEDSPILTPYLVKDSPQRSAVIVFPGGGYTKRADHEGEPVAKWLNTLGIHAFVLHYRVAPYKHPAPLADAQRAVRLVRHHAQQWDIDNNKIGILGFSAGGHLAASLATLHQLETGAEGDEVDRLSAKPDLAILCYPVISMGEFTHAGSKNNLIGDENELIQLLSPHKNVNEQTPPMFIWHTADDAGVPVENSLFMAKALSAQQIPFGLHIYPNGRHGLGLATETNDVSTWTDSCAIWLKNQGF